MKVPVWNEITNESIRQEIRMGNLPVVLKNIVSHWPIVQKAKKDRESVVQYLMGFDQGKSFEAMIAPTSANKKLFYNEDLSGFNFDKMNGSLKDALDILKMLSEHSPAPSFYIGSTYIHESLPGMEEETGIDFLGVDATPKIWISNSATVATHNDFSENIACVAVGKRRFTLFPPDQEDNLYIGPPDLTPAGRPISLVDLNNPDFEKYPLFAEALKFVQVAELEPGDALYIPISWWHHVESLDNFNILINFWWQGRPPLFPEVKKTIPGKIFHE